MDDVGGRGYGKYSRILNILLSCDMWGTFFCSFAACRVLNAFFFLRSASLAVFLPLLISEIPVLPKSGYHFIFRPRTFPMARSNPQGEKWRWRLLSSIHIREFAS